MAHHDGMAIVALHQRGRPEDFYEGQFGSAVSIFGALLGLGVTKLPSTG